MRGEDHLRLTFSREGLQDVREKVETGGVNAVLWLFVRHERRRSGRNRDREETQQAEGTLGRKTERELPFRRAR